MYDVYIRISLIDLLQKFVNIGKTAASRLKTLAQEAETESEVYEDNTHTHTHIETYYCHSFEDFGGRLFRR